MKSQFDGVKLLESQMKSIFKQVMEGVEYLHSNGVYHGDLSFKNILIGN